MPQATVVEGPNVAEIDVPINRRPRHIAIIMDGNGRWAHQRDLPRLFGHREGAKRVPDIVTACSNWGIQALTLYSFSSENWKRPHEEVNALMDLCVEHLRIETERMIARNVKFRRLGRREGLSEAVLNQLDESEQRTGHCTGMTLCLALNYGSRAEIVDAVQALAAEAVAGDLQPSEIDERAISRRLYTGGLPDPDLLIRTAGEMRVSNYLLWQISYAEIHVTDVLWPDFSPADLGLAVQDFAGRRRRFGGLETGEDE